jgi:large subunit ribosomal protein L32
LITCTNCSALILPHRVCSQCGHYKGKEVLQVENY